TVVNTGASNVTANTVVGLGQSGGTALTASYITVPPLNSGQSYTVSIGSVTFNTAGTFYIYANADANAQVAECSENNSTYAPIIVSPNLPDIIPIGGPAGSVFNCPNPERSFTLYNAGGISSGEFSTQVVISHNGSTVATYNYTVPNINAGTYYSFS